MCKQILIWFLRLGLICGVVVQARTSRDGLLEREDELAVELQLCENQGGGGALAHQNRSRPVMNYQVGRSGRRKVDIENGNITFTQFIYSENL